LKSEPKTTKAQVTRDRIMSAALKLFQAKGYDGTTLRDIAQEAQIALGATYYYFKNKQELVLAFYADTQEAAEMHHAEVTMKRPSFKKGMQDLLEYRLVLLEPYRPFLSVLSRHVDPKQAISPFSRETTELRKRAIRMIEDLLQTGNTHISKTIVHPMSVAIWLFQIGLVFFWLNDPSPQQRQTRRLLNITINFMRLSIQMSRNPIFRPVNRNMINYIDIIEENLL